MMAKVLLGELERDVRLVVADGEEEGSLHLLEEANRLVGRLNVRQRFSRLTLQTHGTIQVLHETPSRLTTIDASGTVKELFCWWMIRWCGPTDREIIIEVGGHSWVEDFSDGLGEVTDLFQVLRKSGEVAGEIAPVAVEVVQVESVWTATGQEGVATRSAEGLLERKRD